jgi:hypothetical protein
VIEYGHELITPARPDTRWWVWIEEPIEDLLRRAGWARGDTRPPTPGLFKFARGGMVAYPDQAPDAIQSALTLAHEEARMYAFRPTHELWHDGSLRPLVPDERKAIGS